MKYFIVLGRRKSKMPADSKETVTKTWGLVNIVSVFRNAFEVHPLTVLLKNVFKVCILFFWWITRILGLCLGLAQHKLQQSSEGGNEMRMPEETLNVLALMYFTILAWLIAGSIQYIQDSKSQRSTTAWNRMMCYVLREKWTKDVRSNGKVQVDLLWKCWLWLHS